MARRAGEARVHPDWWTAILIAFTIGCIALTWALFNGSFRRFVPVTLNSDRAGLVMEVGAKVKMRGVQVGRVGSITGGRDPVSLQLELDPDKVRYLPSNVEARIASTSVFGAKYVDLIFPEQPSDKVLAAGAVLQSQNVSTEVNTVFQDLVGVIKKVDPAKLNSVLSAVAEGVRGQGPRMGEATTSANEVLTALNARTEAIGQDWRAFKNFNDTYAVAAPDIIRILEGASATSATVTSNSRELDSLLVNVIGFSQSGIQLLGPNKDNLVNAINTARPTTGLLNKYNPELTCLFLGGKNVIDFGHGDYTGGGNGKSLIVDAALLLGDDPYRYPDNLPINGAKGGPGGKPGCGSLPDVSKNWPVRTLVTDTGFGTGLDNRPNPGIGFPGWANFFPVTRAVPEPPSIRYPGGPAPGPTPPWEPPYGAAQYGPDGTPLFPGVPPAPAVPDAAQAPVPPGIGGLPSDPTSPPQR